MQNTIQRVKLALIREEKAYEKEYYRRLKVSGFLNL